MRLVEAYNIFRRYYDRLPFDPSPEHAEYIGMFVRTLWDLGKDYDLKFYLAELEKLNAKIKSPAILYQLGVVNACLAEPRYEASREMFEQIVKDPAAEPYHAKAKMMLADYYDRIHKDVAACRQLIESIGTVSDPYLAVLVELWKGKLLKDEKKFDEAEEYLICTLSTVDPKENWYAFFSGKVILAGLYLTTKNRDKANITIAEVRQVFEGKRFKTVLDQISQLEEMIQKETGVQTVQFSGRNGVGVLRHAKKSIQLNGKTTSEKLLILFAKRRFLRKEQIMKDVFNRNYDSGRDDKVIYYHIHSLRKKLTEIGLEASSILNEEDGYRFVPEVETLKEEL